MRRASLVSLLFAFAVPLFAQRVVDPNGTTLHLYPDQAHALEGQARAATHGGGGSNLVNHGGPVITSAKVVSIFWGAEWGSQSSPSALANAMLGFFSQFGSTPEYNVITQYSGIQLTSMGQTSWFDGNNPPAAVSDTAVQNEVIAYLNSHPFDSSTVYEVFLPSTSYSTSGGSSSCGGPNLASSWSRIRAKSSGALVASWLSASLSTLSAPASSAASNMASAPAALAG